MTALNLPSAKAIARVLGGHVRRDGDIAFPGPGRKPSDRSCTLRLDANAPDGYVVADARGELPFEVLKDHVREHPGFEPRHRKGNGHEKNGVRELSSKDNRTGEGGAKKTALVRPTASRLHLLPFNDIRLTTRRRDLVKGLIPRTGLTLIYGPPKSGKSFLAFDLAAHVALGRAYRDRRVDQGAAVYCYFEGQSAASARIEAFRQRHLAESADDVPFYLMPVTINLVVEHQALIEAIRGELGTANPAVVVLDTLNRSFQGSESSDQDMSAYVKALDAVREAFECAIIIVHHCGHDATRPRGHTALVGAADAVIGVKKESAGQFIATLEMMKDGANGAVLAGRLEVVDVGRDEDGEQITSCVIVPIDAATTKSAAGAAKLTRNEQLALKALQYALGEVGTRPPASNHIPQNSEITVVTRDQWREYAWKHGISGSEDERAKRQAFQRAVEGLIAKGRVGYWEPLAWPI